jgi:hypothetical protein|tara:strand:+ start:81 stop:440 length:360 start_codon:yes stop_codon:yes gene_type:complete
MADKKPAKKPGQPAFKPTEDERKTVGMMAAMGTPQADIARTIRGKGIDVKTLNKHFKDEIETAATLANAKIGGSMFNKAVAGDVAAQKYWLSCKAGWNDKSEESEKPAVKIEIEYVKAK